MKKSSRTKRSATATTTTSRNRKSGSLATWERDFAESFASQFAELVVEAANDLRVAHGLPPMPDENAPKKKRRRRVRA